MKKIIILLLLPIITKSQHRYFVYESMLFQGGDINSSIIYNPSFPFNKTSAVYSVSPLQNDSVNRVSAYNSVKFILNRSDTQYIDPSYGGKYDRSEVGEASGTSSGSMRERWIGISFYVPAYEVFDTTSAPAIHMQCHSTTSNSSPPFAIVESGSNWAIQRFYDTSLSDVYRVGRIDSILPITKGVWTDFVAHVKFSNFLGFDSSGFINVWVNGVNVYNYTGWVGYPFTTYPYMSFGIYKSWWNGYPYGYTKINQMNIWVSQFRAGNQYSDYTSVAPGNYPLPLPPSGSDKLPLRKAALRKP